LIRSTAGGRAHLGSEALVIMALLLGGPLGEERHERLVLARRKLLLHEAPGQIVRWLHPTRDPKPRRAHSPHGARGDAKREPPTPRPRPWHAKGKAPDAPHEGLRWRCPEAEGPRVRRRDEGVWRRA
jgi:hypothetical protein